MVDGVQSRDIVCPNGNDVVGRLTLELKVHNDSRYGKQVKLSIK